MIKEFCYVQTKFTHVYDIFPHDERILKAVMAVQSREKNDPTETRLVKKSDYKKLEKEVKLAVEALKKAIKKTPHVSPSQFDHSCVKDCFCCELEKTLKKIKVK